MRNFGTFWRLRSLLPTSSSYVIFCLCCI